MRVEAPTIGYNRRPMWTLSIETATLQGGIALARDGVVTAEARLEQGMVHARDLVPAIRRILQDHGLRPGDLGLIACDVGPGSYTGLRVGVATTKAIARFTKARAIGICSLDAMAWDYRAGHPDLGASILLCPALDAKWKQVYYAHYEVHGEGVRRIAGPYADPPRALRRLSPPPIVFGDACATFHLEIQASDSALDPDPRWFFPAPGTIARLGALDDASGRRNTVLGLEPLYLRPSEAEFNASKERGGGNEGEPGLGRDRPHVRSA